MVGKEIFLSPAPVVSHMSFPSLGVRSRGSSARCLLPLGWFVGFSMRIQMKTQKTQLKHLHASSDICNNYLSMQMKLPFNKLAPVRILYVCVREGLNWFIKTPSKNSSVACCRPSSQHAGEWFQRFRNAPLLSSNGWKMVDSQRLTPARTKSLPRRRWNYLTWPHWSVHCCAACQPLC